MGIEKTKERLALHEIMEKELKPYVRKIDQEAFYAIDYMKLLGAEGYFSSQHKLEEEVITERILLVEETAKTCMTTAFCLWCHLAAITYLTYTNNENLQLNILPKLETGEIIAGTGLSNPLKSFANMEQLHLKAKKVNGGFLINGSLPAVSNINENHAFALIAKVNETEKMMGFTFCNVKGMSLRQRTRYLGLNGSATYTCKFNDVFIPDAQVISYEADKFVDSIRALFVSYQTPLGLGVIASSINLIEKLSNNNDAINKNLRVQPKDLQVKYDLIRSRLFEQIRLNRNDWEKTIKIRLDLVYLTLEAVQTLMIHNGGAAYLETSTSARKLREAYFLVNLTPTVKHLEKLLNNHSID